MKEAPASQNTEAFQIKNSLDIGNNSRVRVNNTSAAYVLLLLFFAVFLLTGTFAFLTFLNTLIEPPASTKLITPVSGTADGLPKATMEELSSKGELTFLTGSCRIKGEIIPELSAKIYLLSGQQFYDQTKIKPELGERVFCTEQDAASNGWIKSKV